MLAKVRLLLAAVVAASLFAYGAAGHGLSQMGNHDAMAGSALGLCMVIVAIAVAVGTTPVPELPPRRLRMIAVPAPSTRAPLEVPSDTRARASPIQLQRFRN